MAFSKGKSGYSIGAMHAQIVGDYADCAKIANVQVGGYNGDLATAVPSASVPSTSVPSTFCCNNLACSITVPHAQIQQIRQDDGSYAPSAFWGYAIEGNVAMSSACCQDIPHYSVEDAHSPHGSYNSNDANSGNVMAALSTVLFSSDDEIIHEHECSGIQHYAV